MRLSSVSYCLLIALGVFCWSEGRAAAPLKLSIVPETSDEKSGTWISTITPFYVVVTNLSDSSVRVWREWCSWGYFALSLEARLPDGTAFPIKKKPHDWDKNFPDHFVIPPGGYFVMPVKLHDEWQDYPTKRQELWLRARYRIVPDKDSTKESVWTGELVSPWIKVTVYE